MKPPIRNGEPFDYDIDVWQPTGSTEMVWIHKDRLWQLLNMLSDEFGNECDKEIQNIFPHWKYEKTDAGE